MDYGWQRDFLDDIKQARAFMKKPSYFVTRQVGIACFNCGNSLYGELQADTNLVSDVIYAFCEILLIFRQALVTLLFSIEELQHLDHFAGDDG